MPRQSRMPAAPRSTLPSLTRITMLLKVAATVGTPASCPVIVSNLAHEGLLSTLNTSVSRLASLDAGVNEYGVPTFAVVTGVPEIVGAEFVTIGATAVMPNVG